MNWRDLFGLTLLLAERIVVLREHIRNELLSIDVLFLLLSLSLTNEQCQMSLWRIVLLLRNDNHEPLVLESKLASSSSSSSSDEWLTLSQSSRPLPRYPSPLSSTIKSSSRRLRWAMALYSASVTSSKIGASSWTCSHCITSQA